MPDLVFTANAGLLHGKRFVISRFRHKERRQEEPFFRNWFQNNGYSIVDLEGNVHFEGAGDALFQPGRDLLWVSHGFRTDPEVQALLAEELKVRVLSLKLEDPRFYHLDTCFCPLNKDQILYYPQAFDAASQELIAQNVHPENRIALSTEDAVNFACNAVLIENRIILNYASDDLRQKLENAGYEVYIQPVPEFLKAGGANKCLTFALGEA